jgi:hypothetical protein
MIFHKQHTKNMPINECGNCQELYTIDRCRRMLPCLHFICQSCEQDIIAQEVPLCPWCNELVSVDSITTSLDDCVESTQDVQHAVASELKLINASEMKLSEMKDRMLADKLAFINGTNKTGNCFIKRIEDEIAHKIEQLAELKEITDNKITKGLEIYDVAAKEIIIAQDNLNMSKEFINRHISPSMLSIYISRVQSIGSSVDTSMSIIDDNINSVCGDYSITDKISVSFVIVTSIISIIEFENQLIVATGDFCALHSVRLFSMTGVFIKKLFDVDWKIESISVDSDGTLYVMGNQYWSPTVLRYRKNNQKQWIKVKDIDIESDTILFTVVGNEIITICDNNMISLLNLEGINTHTFRISESNDYICAISPDEKLGAKILVLENNHLKIFDLQGTVIYKCYRIEMNTSKINNFVHIPNTNRIIASYDNFGGTGSTVTMSDYQGNCLYTFDDVIFPHLQVKPWVEWPIIVLLKHNRILIHTTNQVIIL